MARFRSKLEERVSDLLLHHRVGYEYESAKLPYTLHCSYCPDFLLPSGIFLEVKGVLDADDRRKMLAVKRNHPDVDIRFVFQNPFSRMPHLKTTHAQWAEKNGFQWCHYQSIPKSWLNPPTTNSPSQQTSTTTLKKTSLNDTPLATQATDSQEQIK